MVKIRIVKITMNINCDCGKKFMAEDCEPICPYCDRKYQVTMYAGPAKTTATIISVSKKHAKAKILMHEIVQSEKTPSHSPKAFKHTCKN